MNFTRRRLFTLAAPVIVAGGGYGRFFEPGWLVETEKHVKIGGRLPGRPLRILLLSDLHASAVVPLSFLLNSFQMGAAAKPDIICLTGDKPSLTAAQSEALGELITALEAGSGRIMLGGYKPAAPGLLADVD